MRNYILGFLTAFIALFKRGYLYGLVSGMTIFTVYAFDNINTNPSSENNLNVVENEIIIEDVEIKQLILTMKKIQMKKNQIL